MDFSFEVYKGTQISGFVMSNISHSMSIVFFPVEGFREVIFAGSIERNGTYDKFILSMDFLKGGILTLTIKPDNKLSIFNSTFFGINISKDISLAKVVNNFSSSLIFMALLFVASTIWDLVRKKRVSNWDFYGQVEKPNALLIMYPLLLEISTFSFRIPNMKEYNTLQGLLAFDMLVRPYFVFFYWAIISQIGYFYFRRDELHVQDQWVTRFGRECTFRYRIIRSIIEIVGIVVLPIVYYYLIHYLGFLGTSPSYGNISRLFQFLVVIIVPTVLQIFEYIMILLLIPNLRAGIFIFFSIGIGTDFFILKQGMNVYTSFLGSTLSSWLGDNNPLSSVLFPISIFGILGLYFLNFALYKKSEVMF